MKYRELGKTGLKLSVVNASMLGLIPWLKQRGVGIMKLWPVGRPENSDNYEAGL